MPRLKVVEADQASGKVKETYNNLNSKFGKVFNIFKGMGNSAAALNAYLNMSATLGEGDLSPEDREVVYLAVSERNKCHYCASAHTVIAKNAGMSDIQILAARKHEGLDDKHQTLVRFINRVMDTQGFVDDADVEAVRDAGYTDGQIAESIAYIGLATYSNLFNHVFDTELDFPAAPKL